MTNQQDNVESLWKENLILSGQDILKEDNWKQVVGFVVNTPKHCMPVGLIQYIVPDIDLHITVLYSPLTLGELALFYNLSCWVHKNIGETVFATLGEKTDFNSFLFPDSEIRLVDLKGIKASVLSDVETVYSNEFQRKLLEYSHLLNLIRGYHWKPHITFKTPELMTWWKEKDVELRKLYLDTFGGSAYPGQPMELVVSFYYTDNEVAYNRSVDRHGPEVWKRFLNLQEKTLWKENESIRTFFQEVVDDNSPPIE